MTAASLRTRWRTRQTVDAVTPLVQSFLEGTPLDRTLDLRGASIGLEGPFAAFELKNGHFTDLDISHGSGALVIALSEVSQLVAHRFKCDRASRFSAATITASSFTEARLRLDVREVLFENVDFAASSFAGGYEYGFRRCRFRSCNFQRIAWHHTYIRACEFHNCQFEAGVVSHSIVAGFKVFGPAPQSGFFSACEKPSIYVDGVPWKAPGAA